MIDLVVLDSGAIDRVENSRVLRGVLRRLVEAGATVEIPAITLAEATTGRHGDAAVNRVIKRFGTVPTEELLSRRAGALRHAARAGRKRLPSAVDAIVAAHAVIEKRPAVIFTTDVDDLSALTARFSRVVVEPA